MFADRVASDEIELSVVIPTHNRRRSLMRTLQALAEQTLPPAAFEVIAVSDGSTDGTADAVHACVFPYRCRMIDQPNLGPSAARNNGLRAACGDLVVFLDDDVEPDTECLKEHLRAHAEDAGLVLIGPQSMPRGERFPVWIAWEHQMLERQYARFRAGEWQAGPNNLYSGNFSARREHLLAAGGFDERFKRQEDVELGFRLAALGLRFRFEARANGWHRPERSFQSWYMTPYLYGVRDVQMSRDKGEDQALALARKHYAERNRLTQFVARCVIGHRLMELSTLAILRRAILLADWIRVRPAALALCSLTFNLRYLQGMAREMGDARRMWGTICGKSPEAHAA